MAYRSEGLFSAKLTDDRSQIIPENLIDLHVEASVGSWVISVDGSDEICLAVEKDLGPLSGD